MNRHNTSASTSDFSSIHQTDAITGKQSDRKIEAGTEAEAHGKMASPSLELLTWSRRRWFAMIGLIIILQLGFILWLEETEAGRTRAAIKAPAFRLAARNGNELLELADPTLLVLPNQNGFSGPAWLRFAPPPAHSFEWSEPVQYLESPLQELGQSFHHFMQTNQFESEQTLPGPGAELAGTECVSLARRTQSDWRLEGALATRRLLTSFSLPSWAAIDLLTNTLVQIVIDKAGKPISATLLPPGSGSPDADRFALDLARTARFEPAKGGAADELSWGTMVFEWNTLLK